MSRARWSTAARPAAAALAVGLLAVLLPSAAPALEVPFLSGRVVDLAEMISPEAEGRITAKLATLEAETGAQLAVLTLASLEGEVLEEYSLRVVETWRLGRAEVDDGVLLLVVRDDRKMRIEVGYGLEGTLTDAQSGRILRNLLTPAFRQGDFDGGIEAGVDAIAGAVRGEEVEIPEEPQNLIQGFEGPLSMRLGGLALFLAFMSVFALSAIFSKGCGSWMMWLFLMPFFGLFPSAIVHPKAGLIIVTVWILLFPILKILLRNTKVGKRWMKSRPNFARGWTSSGGGSSGGGFSGGGGSFGGGGASGSW